MCPVCKCEALLDYGPISIEGNLAIQEVSCGKCDAEWHDVYVFSEFVIDREREEKTEMEKKKYVLLKPIVIPVGTVFSEAPGETMRCSDHYDCVIGFGKNHVADFILHENLMEEFPDQFATLK